MDVSGQNLFSNCILLFNLLKNLMTIFHFILKPLVLFSPMPQFHPTVQWGCLFYFQGPGLAWSQQTSEPLLLHLRKLFWWKTDGTDLCFMWEGGNILLWKFLLWCVKDAFDVFVLLSEIKKLKCDTELAYSRRWMSVALAHYQKWKTLYFLNSVII